jgi:two-component system, cell cycle sensor histidine kinase and response regulator CckA
MGTSSERGGTVTEDPAAPDARGSQHASRLSEPTEPELRGLIEQATQGVLVTQDERAVYVNRALREMTQHRGEALTRQSLFDFLHPEDRAEVARRYQRVLGGEGPLGAHVFRTVDGEGTVRWFRISSIRIDWGGRPAVASFVENITEAKKAEQALSESEARYRQLVDHAPTALCELDAASQRLVRVNDVMCETTGYSRDELLSMPVQTLLSGDSRTLSLDRRQRFLHGNPTAEEVEYRVKTKHGREVWVLVHSRVIRGADGRVTLAVVVHDITERKRLEAERNKLQKLESLGTLAGGIAHDFNNILTSAVGTLSLARRSAGRPERQLSLLEEAERACLRARDLTQQLLTFSSGGAPIRKPVSVGALVSECAAFALRGASSRCTVSVAQGLWPVEADPAQLGQVIHNLVLNADQAMPAGGVVELAVDNVELGSEREPGLPAGRYVRIVVRDHGVGMTGDLLGRIFDPYFTTKQKGSGLGLATAYSIISKHGGTIDVESEPGRGSSFTLLLPASQQAPGSGAQSPRPPLTGSGRVLLMDDDEHVRSAGAAMLRYLGYEATCAEAGAEAIELYQRQRREGEPFVLVITDLTVPGGMGGRETAARLRDIDPEVKVVVASGYADGPVLSNAAAHGFCGVLSKPFTLEELAEVLKRALETGPADR